MYSNEQVFQAVTDLMDTYNKMSGLITDYKLPVPLYEDGRIVWEGWEDFDITDAPFTTDITLVGAQAMAKISYGNMYCLSFSAGSALVDLNSVPVNYWVVKVKVPENKDGTFFLKIANPDNSGFGAKYVYACNPDGLTVNKLLGVQIADKGSGEGFSPVFSPDNKGAVDTRYHQWVAYNYNWEDIQGLLDSEGYAYFGVCGSIAAYYISGWAVAVRKTNFMWNPGFIMGGGFLGNTNKATLVSTNSNGLYRYSFPRAATTTAVRIPYTKGSNLLVGAFINNDPLVYTPKLDLLGNITRTAYTYTDDIPKGNFARIAVAPNVSRFRFWEIPANEVEANTITIRGLKMLVLDVVGSAAEKLFYFNGFYTETIGE